MVMATGIVSLAAHLLAMESMAKALFRLNIAFYAALWFLTVLRMVRYPRRFFGDMVDHLRGPGFFTTVAATSVLGSQFVVLAADYRTATVLWIVAVVLWIGLTYTIFTGFTIKERKPTTACSRPGWCRSPTCRPTSTASTAAPSTAAQPASCTPRRSGR